MVNKFLLNLLIQHGGKVLKSAFKAYKETVKDMPKTSNSNNNQNNNDNSNKNFADKFSFNNFMVSPMTKEEALKILNLKQNEELTSETIIEKFEKYMEANNPEKGGSFYLQNKIYYAKEFLMLDFPEDENKSKYNPEEINEKV